MKKLSKEEINECIFLALVLTLLVAFSGCSASIYEGRREGNILICDKAKPKPKIILKQNEKPEWCDPKIGKDYCLDCPVTCGNYYSEITIPGWKNDKTLQTQKK